MVLSKCCLKEKCVMINYMENVSKPMMLSLPNASGTAKGTSAVQENSPSSSHPREYIHRVITTSYLEGRSVVARRRLLTSFSITGVLESLYATRTLDLLPSAPCLKTEIDVHVPT